MKTPMKLLLLATVVLLADVISSGLICLLAWMESSAKMPVIEIAMDLIPWVNAILSVFTGVVVLEVSYKIARRHPPYREVRLDRAEIAVLLVTNFLLLPAIAVSLLVQLSLALYLGA